MMEFILAQILGGIALILVCVGYFLKKKAHLLITQTVANFFYASACIIADGYVAGVLTAISVARCIYLYIADKHSFKYTYHFLIVFIVLYITLTIIFWDSPWDILPLITSTLFTIGLTVKNLQKVRYILIVPNVLLIFYNILQEIYTNALRHMIELIVICVVIIKNIINKKRQSRNNQHVEQAIER